MRNDLTIATAFLKGKDLNSYVFVKAFEGLELKLNNIYCLEVYVLPIGLVVPVNCSEFHDLDISKYGIRIERVEFWFEGNIKVFLDLYRNVFANIVVREMDYYLLDDGLVCHNLFIVPVAFFFFLKILKLS